MASTTFSGPVTSTAGFISGADSIVSATDATLAVTSAAHSGRTVLLDRAAGQAVTLPAGLVMDARTVPGSVAVPPLLV